MAVTISTFYKKLSVEGVKTSPCLILVYAHTQMSCDVAAPKM